MDDERSDQGFLSKCLPAEQDAGDELPGDGNRKDQVQEGLREVEGELVPFEHEPRVGVDDRDWQPGHSDTGEIVIIEAKYKTSSATKTVTKRGWLEMTEGKDRQMSDEWVDGTIEELGERADTPEQRRFVRELEESQIRREIVTVQDRPKNGFTVDGSLNTIELDISDVDIVKLGQVLDE